MRKIIMGSLFIVLSLSGCAAALQQHHTAQLMEDYTFNAPAEKVYSAAESVFAELRSPLTRINEHEGATAWTWQRHELGMSSYNERTRLTVEVIPHGDNQSKLRVFKESAPDKNAAVTLTSDMAKSSKQRITAYDHMILQKVDPAAASKVESAAALM